MNTTQNEPISKGAIVPVGNSIREAIIHFLMEALDKNCFNAVLIPVRVPAGDSYSWILTQDKSIIENANPIAPVMPVQGAKALSSLTRKGRVNLKIASIMRPCELRAVIELSKLKQIDLDNVCLISFDCPGALPMSDYLDDPEKGEDVFNSLLVEEIWDNEPTKPVCKMCDNFSIPNCDLHFGLLGTQDSGLLIIPNSARGESILDSMGIDYKEDLSDWENKVSEVKVQKQRKKEETYDSIQPMVEGLDSLLTTFANCIGCHNCMAVCPICYCRKCYFDSEVAKFTSDNYLLRAEKRGGLRFPPDTLLFHSGRMSHMTLSCVSCGMCEDACPVSIPVAQIFSYVADKTQRAFEYQPGKDIGEPLPLKDYKEEEHQEIKELAKDFANQEKKDE